MEDEGTIITMLEGALTESNEVSWSARGGGGGVYIGQVANKSGAKLLRVQPSQELKQNQLQIGLWKEVEQVEQGR